MKLNVVICIESFFDGGAEVFAIRLANAMADLHNVFFLELEPYDTREKNQLKLLNLNKVKLFQPGKGRLGNLLFSKVLDKPVIGRLQQSLFKIYYRRKEKRIKAFLSNNNIHIVHSHCWTTDYYFAGIKDTGKFRLVLSLHGHYEALRNHVYDFLNKASFAVEQADKIIYLTGNHLETLKQIGADFKKLSRIFYGFDFDPDIHPAKRHDGILKVLLVARGIPEKGWEQLISAVNFLLVRSPDSVILKLVGDSEYVHELKSKFESSNIMFCGYQDNVISFVKDADICALPSYFAGESLPNSVIEYMSLGKPVISTDIGSIKDMISVGDDIAGSLLTLKQGKPDVEDLIQAIDLYIKQPEMLEVHSKISIEGSKKFTMEKCVFNYNKVYQELFA